MITEFRIVPSAMDIGNAIKGKEIIKALALIMLKSFSYVASLIYGVSRIWRKTKIRGGSDMLLYPEQEWE